MAESILTSTKATLGVPETHTAFDAMLIVYINAVFSRLRQLGCGPDAGYRISDVNDTWEDFFGEGLQLDNVKSYMTLRVRLLFDPPEIGFVLNMIKDELKEEEVRIMIDCDPDVVVPERMYLDPFGESVLVVPAAPLPEGTVLDGGDA